MVRILTSEEADALFILIKAEGVFYKNKNIDKSLIEIGKPLESSFIETETNHVSFNRSCRNPKDPENFPLCTSLGIYEGSAKLIGLNQFELNNPIIIKDR